MHLIPDGSTHPGDREGCKVCEHPEALLPDPETAFDMAFGSPDSTPEAHLTGPEHYALAEQLVAEALRLPRAVLNVPGPISDQAAEQLKTQFTKRTGVENVVVLSQGITTNSADLIAAAQVHAQLADTAARLFLDSELNDTPRIARDWQNAAG